VFVGFIALSAVISFFPIGKRNVFQYIGFALTAIGVLLTFKRHFWGASFLLFLIIIYLSRQKELNRMIVAGIVSLSFALLGVFFLMNYTGEAGPDLIAGSVDRFTSLTKLQTYNDPNSSLRWRDFEYEYAAPQIAAHPFFGLGLGAVYRPFVPDKDVVGRELYDWIHNGYLAVLTFTGFLGLFPILWMMVLTLYRGFKYWRNIQNYSYRVYMLGFTLAILGMLIGTWVEPMVIETRWTALVAVMMGVNEVIIKTRSNHP
jgi:O-antigen ligase